MLHLYKNMVHESYSESYIEDDSEVKNKITLVPEISRTNYSMEIKIEANRIWHEPKNKHTRKGKMREKFVFFCIYRAHTNLGIVVDPKLIARDLGLSNGDISKAISAFSGGVTGYNYNRPNSAKPTELIPVYCEKLGCSEETTEQIIALANEIIEKDKKMSNGVLLEYFPQKVAIGIIFYYAQIYGINIDRAHLSSDLLLSEATINTIVRQITTIHNN